jgi:hypothetical protein
MPDFSSTLDVVAEQYRQNETHALHVDAAWRIVLTVGVALVIVAAVVAFILYVCWFLESWRNRPPPPTSIIPEQPDERRRYTGPRRR